MIEEEQSSPTYPYAQKINELKAKLRATDYKAIKYAEGVLSFTEYAPIRAEREAYRAEINELEAKIAELKE